MPLYNAPRPLKRKLSTMDYDPTFRDPISGRPFKRAKSENVSQLRRYLIGCAHLLYVKNDNRDRDNNDIIIPLPNPPKKAYAPSSDLAQKDMVSLYFDDIDRTVVSQSKSKTHQFATPDWSLMETYLFPWIRVNVGNPQLTLTRIHIKHVAFRIWEYLSNRGDVVIKYEDDVVGVPENV